MPLNFKTKLIAVIIILFLMILATFLFFILPYYNFNSSEIKVKTNFAEKEPLAETEPLIEAEPLAEPKPSKEPSKQSLKDNLIKSVRLDLSSVSEPKDFDKFIEEILNRLNEVGANAVFISPWSDGFATYNSSIAPQNKFGNKLFLEKFIKRAHKLNIQVYAWFVVGKDNFPKDLHPEWFSKTLKGYNYIQDDGGVDLPVASLANDEYIAYHLSLLQEVNELPIDGWVFSEPLASWGDRYDDDYADFSEGVIKKFKLKAGIDPREIFDESSDYFYENNALFYSQWVDFRAEIVTDFIKESIEEVRSNFPKPIIITLFTEPDKRSQLVSFSSLREWLGMDIDALASLGPNYMEIQGVFLDFEFPQKPEWVKDMIRQFRLQFNYEIPIMMSVQGFDTYNRPPSSKDFSIAISSAMAEDIAGVSFYAYHTLREEHWEALKKLWR